MTSAFELKEKEARDNSKPSDNRAHARLETLQLERGYQKPAEVQAPPEPKRGKGKMDAGGPAEVRIKRATGQTEIWKPYGLNFPGWWYLDRSEPNQHDGK